MEVKGSGGAGQALEVTDIHVGLRVPWSEALNVLRRWQLGDHSLGGTPFRTDKTRGGSHTKVFKCQYCDFYVKFEKRESSQPGGVSEAECMHISEQHGPECEANARKDGIGRVVSPTNR